MLNSENAVFKLIFREIISKKSSPYWLYCH